MKNTLLYLLIFILIGELMIRFENTFVLLEENRVVKISTNIEITPEYQLIKDNKFQFNDTDLRIMVIGDSYIHGGGIEFQHNFSQQLKKMFENKKSNFNKIWVLDISRSSSNNLDNNLAYFQFVDEFKPNIVILGYNLNDIDGNLDKDLNKNSGLDDFNEIKPSGKNAQSKIRKINEIIYNSKFINFVFRKAHSYIKTFGIVIPNSRFDLTMKSYYQNKKNWMKSKVLLNEVIDDVYQKDIQLIVYKFPQMNLIAYPELFLEADKTIEQFFENSPSVLYKNGSIVLGDDSADKYRISKYDGHPNEVAHKKMAKEVFKMINYSNNF